MASFVFSPPPFLSFEENPLLFGAGLAKPTSPARHRLFDPVGSPQGQAQECWVCQDPGPTGAAKGSVPSSEQCPPASPSALHQKFPPALASEPGEGSGLDPTQGSLRPRAHRPRTPLPGLAATQGFAPIDAPASLNTSQGSMDKAGNCQYRGDFANIANPPRSGRLSLQPPALTLPLPRLPPPRDTTKRGPWPAPGEDSGDRMALGSQAAHQAPGMGSQATSPSPVHRCSLWAQPRHPGVLRGATHPRGAGCGQHPPGGC